MPLRNRPEVYGVVSKTLHWVTVAALLAQLAIGYAMDWGDDSGRGRGRGRGGESGRGRGRGGDDGEGWQLPALGDDDWTPLHVAAHLVLYAAVAVHLTLVLRRRLLSRMLPRSLRRPGLERQDAAHG